MEDSADQPQFVVYLGRVQVSSHRPNCLDHIELLIHMKYSKPCVDSSKWNPNLQMQEEVPTLCELWISGGAELSVFGLSVCRSGAQGCFRRPVCSGFLDGG